MLPRSLLGARAAWLAAIVLGASAVGVAPARAQDGVPCDPACQATHMGKPCPLWRLQHPPGPGAGTLGYGPPGVFPGFQGFGLGYGKGYGYGGAGLGTEADGGYPFYGGPGYPHPWPTLKRFPICGINPFPHFGGPPYPRGGCTNYFTEVPPLVADAPVVEIAPEPGEPDYAHGFGAFTGAVPYSEAQLAPFTTRAGLAGSSSGVSTLRPAPPVSNAPAGRPGTPNP